MGKLIFEPTPAVVAARLTSAMACEFQLQLIQPGIAYLTGNEPLDHPALEPFVIDELLPFDLKRLKAAVRTHGVGTVEIKKRGVVVEPAELQRQLRLKGDHPATLLLFPHAGQTWVAVAHRP